MKIKIYILFFLLLFAATSYAQIQHFTNLFNGDIDGDGIEDFVFEREISQSFDASIESGKIIPQNGAEIATSIITFKYGGSDRFARYFELNDTISEKSDWSANPEEIYQTYNNQPKIWWVDQDYFFGLRIKKNDGYYYGWVRFRGNTLFNTEFVREAALQLTPDVPIKAGEGILSIKPVVGFVSDKGDSCKWSDYNVEFYSPYYSSFVNNYRAFILKSENANELEIDELLNASANKFLDFDAGENLYNFDLQNHLLDLDNEEIKLGESYQMCILSISNNLDSFPTAFSLTDTFTINVVLPKVNSPVVLDNGDLGNSKDIQITFDKNEQENFVLEYRVLILPADSANSFSLVQAFSVPSENFHTVLPTGDSIYCIENIETNDIYGNSIQQKKLYKVFILSVHDDIKSNVSSLSVGSNNCSLNAPNFIYSGQTEGENLVYKNGEITTTQDTCSLDFDNDGQPDIIVSGTDWIDNNHPRINMVLHSDENIQVIYSEENLTKNLKLYFPINDDCKWSSDTLTLIYEKTDFGIGTTYGEFEKYRDGIFGFKKITENDTIYGWVRINSGSIKDYAWKSATVQSISTIPDLIETSFYVYPNPNSDRILNIAIKEFIDGEDYFIDVFNSSGIKIKTIKTETKLSKISLENLQRGIYFVRLNSSEKQEALKIMLL